MKFSSLAAGAVAALLGITVTAADARPIVQFDTALGSFQVELFDDAAPLTVANFLSYATNDDYDGSFFNRLIPGFVLQGGGFFFNGTQFGYTDRRDPVPNEFGISNTRGTIAMAKLSNDPNSATNEFFFNLADNSENLDNQNGGFTVFGQVIGNGMEVVDELAALPRWDASAITPAFGDLPLIGYENPGPIQTRHLAMIWDVRLIPEPAAASLLALGLGGLALRRR